MAKMLIWAVCAVVTAASGASNSGEWVDRDVGDCKIRGNALFDKETSRWVVRASGADIFQGTDGFHFVYRQLRGDGSITARVESVANTNEYAKAGIMIRESMDPGSKHALTVFHFNGQLSFQRRTEAGKTTLETNQLGVKAPCWLKLTRTGNKFTAQRSADGVVWEPIVSEAESTAEVQMAANVYIGLAVCSHAGNVLCEARFDHVVVLAGEVTDAEIQADPNQAVHKAYRNLSQLGNWREDAALKKRNENLIANSLIAIAKVSELRKAAPSDVLADYYRVVELVPDSPATVDALSRIAVLDKDKGLPFAVKQLGTRQKEDRDRFYLALMKGCTTGLGARESERPVKLFVEYVGTLPDVSLLEEAIRNLEGSANEVALRKSLIQCGMSQPSTERIAIATLRSMALKANSKEKTAQVLELARWGASQFKDTKLAVCARTVLADAEYGQGRYVEALQEFQPGLLAAGQAESKMVEMIESAVPLYRSGTLRSDGVVGDQIYEAMAQRASGSGLSSVAAHCYKKLAEAKGLSMDSFTKSAKAGTKYSGSTPENEMWFWKGCLAALEEDPTIAVQAYERFLKQDNKSVLAARAYYDTARIKMAIGEDARDWVAKAKAISPCQEVVQLETKLGAKAAP